jgi:hypothetical protein
MMEEEEVRVVEEVNAKGAGEQVLARRGQTRTRGARPVKFR